MIALPTNTDIFLYSHPTDMRKSFCGLAGIVRNELQREPADGSLFLFINRSGDKLKALYWDRDGLALWYKRLERGSFERVRREGQDAIQIDAAELTMLLGGISIEKAKRRKRLDAA
jgi:transposase